MLITYLGAFIKIFFDIYSFLIIVRVLMSWFPQRPHNALFDFITDVTNPVLNLAKKIIPPLGMIDLSPIIVLVALDLLKSLLLALLNIS
jgi:YggT family protein